MSDQLWAFEGFLLLQEPLDGNPVPSESLTPVLLLGGLWVPAQHLERMLKEAEGLW